MTILVTFPRTFCQSLFSVRFADLAWVLPMITVADVECQESYGHNDSQDFHHTKESEQTNGHCQQFVDGSHLVHWNTTTYEKKCDMM